MSWLRSAGVVLGQTLNGKCQVDIRSQKLDADVQNCPAHGNVDVHKIASHFEGGGHKMASGMTVDGPMEAAVEKVIAEVRDKFPLDS